MSGGEDAWFADARLDALGVADGVGGSKTKEVDPGVFSRRLLAFCRAGLALGLAPEAALEEARRCVKRDALASAGGSSTALVATLRGEELRVANFGDSGLLLLRPCPRRFSQKRLARAPRIVRSLHIIGPPLAHTELVGRRKRVFFRAQNEPKRRERKNESASTTPNIHARDDAQVLWPRVVLRSHEQTHYFNCPYQAAAQDAVLDARSVGAAAADVLAAVAWPREALGKKTARKEGQKRHSGVLIEVLRRSCDPVT